MYANAGGFFESGYFYAVNCSKMWGSVFTNMTAYDIDLWEADYTKNKGSNNMKMSAFALAYDPVNKVGYGCFRNADDDGYELGVADYTEFTRSTLCSIKSPIVAMALADDGTLYCIDTTGALSTMDKSTGVLTDIGSTGLNLEEKLQGCIYDPASESIIMAAEPTDGTSALYSINPADATATLLVTMPNNQHITVLSMPQEPADGAPAKAENLALDFDGGSTFGTVSFDIPELTSGGASLTGNIRYTISVNDDGNKSGTATPGTKVSEPLSVEEGTVKVVVVLSNDAGNSRKVSANRYVGYAWPASPQSVKAVLDEQTRSVAISWDAVTEVWSDGYISPADLRYKVVRFPDNNVVAESTTGTQCTDNLEWGYWTGYKYEVYCINGTQQSYAGRSNYIALGEPLTAPYSENFATENGFAGYSIIKGGDEPDRSSWYYDENACDARITSNSYTDDDWLVTPPITLKKGSIHEFSFTCKESFTSSRYKDCLAVTFGRSGNPAENDMLMPATDINWSEARMMSFEITVAEDGVYRFAFHALSEKNTPGIVIDDIALGEGFDGQAPAKAEHIRINGGPRGELSATVTFNLPSLTVNGSELAGVTRVEVYRDGELCSSAENGLTPGAEIILTDGLVGLTAGYHDYSVIAYADAMRGRTATTRAFIGPDAPAGVRELRFEDNYDGTATLRWNEPAEVGINGGYATSEGLKYNLTITNDEGTVLAEEITTDREYTVTGLDQTGKQRFISATVVASNAQGQGSREYVDAPIAGAPYELPFHEQLNDGFTTYSTWHSSIMNGSQFGIQIVVGGDMSTEGACFSYSASQSGDHSTLYSGKISLAGAAKPELTFDYATMPGENAILEVMVDKATRGLETVATLDFNKLEETGKRWEKYAVDLTPFKEHPYILLNFKGTMFATGRSMMLGNIAIRDKESSGITDIANENGTRVHVNPQNNGVTVLTDDAVDVAIYGLTGVCVYAGRAEGCLNIELGHGCYIVRAGTNTVKILI